MTLPDLASDSSIELTGDEMLKISEEISRQFSPDQGALAAVQPVPAASGLPEAALSSASRYGDFSYRDLQAIGRDISQRFAPKAGSAAPEILLLPVDPHHLYAYWDVGRSLVPAAAGNYAHKPLTLRIYWRPDAGEGDTRSHVWFDVPAEPSSNRTKVRLPIDDTYYSADLGRLKPDHSLEILAHSNLIHVPTAPGRKRAAPPAPALSDRSQGEGFPEGWSIKLHVGDRVSPYPEFNRLSLELMNLFNASRIDAELIPEFALTREPESPCKNASGLGL
ncbi:MAG: DUF4912 domain-containing protein [Gammaproteobacteria bacterium]